MFYGTDKAGVVTVNGGRGRANNYSVNGGDGNDLFANLPAVQPSPDSIEEFRVITVCCNPPINNWDMGLFKDTGLGERMRLQFRTEIFNVFNHAQFYGVDGNSGNQGSTFGQPQKVRDPRLLQFALKLIF